MDKNNNKFRDRVIDCCRDQEYTFVTRFLRPFDEPCQEQVTDRYYWDMRRIFTDVLNEMEEKYYESNT